MANAGEGRVLLTWTPESWLEVLCSTCLLPFCQRFLDTPWCTRVECTDASLGGHGRAYTTISESTASEIARQSDCPGCYTSLSHPEGVAINAQNVCPLARVELPKGLFWHTVPRPGGHDHINLEEAKAVLWSVSQRLLRPSEVNTRVLQGGDNAACVGAFNK
eukprot:4794471-Amphidinium_carterae.1